MALLKKSFVILTSLLNGILYINQPYGVKNVAVCLNSICENRSQFILMSNTTINDDHLAVFYISFPPNISTYTLKLLFPDGTEGDSNAISISSGNVCNEERKDEDYMKQIFILTCFTLSSLLLIILRHIIIYLKKMVI